MKVQMRRPDDVDLQNRKNTKVFRNAEKSICFSGLFVYVRVYRYRETELHSVFKMTAN